MLLFASAAQAQNASPIPDVGRMQDIPGAYEVPDPSETYKIVFDLSSTSDKIDEANPGLVAVAALVNTFAHFGVDAEHQIDNDHIRLEPEGNEKAAHSTLLLARMPEPRDYPLLQTPFRWVQEWALER
jgi:hypothetical protein